MTILIKKGLCFVEKQFVQKDILIDQDKIVKIADKISNKSDIEIDATGMHVVPGFVDLHAHLRDPGQTYKEDIVTGTRAAAKGGFTTICAMPNTDPIVDNIATVEFIKRKAADLGRCKVQVIGALTKKSEGKEISEMATMLEGGIVAVSDDGACVQNSKIMQNCMKYATNFGLPVIVHAEEYSLAGKGQIHAGKVATKLGLSGISPLAEELIIFRDIMLAESTKTALHIAHVSTARSLKLIAEAKERGVNITCEVTPHHLTMNEEACLSFDTNTKVKPPLRTENDRQALIAGLRDGLIDCIATDHAPHADYEKELEFDNAPFGINGFETAFASIYTELVEKGQLTLERVIEAMTVSPSTILSLGTGELQEGKYADLAILNLKATVNFSAETILSKSKNTPYLGKMLQGKVETTICNGKITWDAKNADNC